jgi:hypothetical protein
MILKSGTVLMCDLVLDRYLDLLAEHPDAAPPEFKQALVDASMNLKQARYDEFMAISRDVRAIPTEIGQSSLLSQVARE